MTPEQKQVIRTSFEQVKRITDVAATLFYGRLFDLDPNLERLFKGDLHTQGRMLFQVMTVVVDATVIAMIVVVDVNMIVIVIAMSVESGKIF